MAVKASRVTVGTTAARLDVATEADKTSDSAFASFRGDGKRLAFRNRGAVNVYVGGSDVTAAQGFQVDPGELFTDDLLPRDEYYGITASSTAECHVIEGGV